MIHVLGGQRATNTGEHNVSDDSQRYLTAALECGKAPSSTHNAGNATRLSGLAFCFWKKVSNCCDI